MSKNDAIMQLSIFINNEPNSLANMAQVLKDCGVNLKAFNIAESAGFGVFRAVVDNPEDAYKKLKAKDLVIKQTEIVAVAVKDTPGGLLSAAKVLGDANINIEYGYAYEGKVDPIIFLRVDDAEAAIKAFTKANMKVVSMKDL